MRMSESHYEDERADRAAKRVVGLLSQVAGLMKAASLTPPDIVQTARYMLEDAERKVGKAEDLRQRALDTQQVIERLFQS